MRIPAICGLVLCLATGNAAAGDVYEPHALLYYQVSFSGSAQDRKASYGLRLDQTYHARNETPDFRQLLARPALAELSFDSEGAGSLNIAGFGRAYRMHRANGEGSAGTEAPAEPEAGEPAAEEPQPETASDEEDGRSLGEYLEEIPAGYLIGIGLGVVLVTGLAD